MSHPNKVRGNSAESYIVERCEAHGVYGERAWASDGRAMGLESKDDGLIGSLRWQSKRFKFQNVVRWFVKNAIEYLHGGQHVVTFYVDRASGHPRTVYTILDLETFLSIYAKAGGRPEGRRDVQSG